MFQSLPHRPSLLIGGVRYTALSDLFPVGWNAAAMAHGFELLRRIRDPAETDRHAVALQCNRCSGLQAAWLEDILAGNLRCQACRRARIAAAATTIGAEIVLWDQDAVQVRLACGHTHRLSQARLVDAGTGGPAIACAFCHEEHYAAIATARDRRLLGPASTGSPGHRSFAHGCGHIHDAALVDLYHRRATCPICEERRTGRCAIYLVQIDAPYELLKLGAASDVRQRKRGLAANCRKTFRRILSLPSRQAAFDEENRLHTHLRRTHPELQPPPERSQGISGQGEVYELRAEAVIMDHLDAIEARYARYDGHAGEIAPGVSAHSSSR